MAAPIPTASDRRRASSSGERLEKRRWSDDPDLTAAFERLAVDVGRTMYELRERQDWSQHHVAAAAGLCEGTVCDVERTTTDPRLSTLVRMAYVLGYELTLSARRPSPSEYPAP